MDMAIIIVLVVVMVFALMVGIASFIVIKKCKKIVDDAKIIKIPKAPIMEEVQGPRYHYMERDYLKNEPTENQTTLDTLLADIIRRQINDLNIIPEIKLKNSGEYKVLGKTWQGEVTLFIEPKRNDEITTETADENKAPVVEEEKADDKSIEEKEKESLF